MSEAQPSTQDTRTKKCPECYRPVSIHATQCHWSDCHAYFEKGALLWLQREKILERARQVAEEARKAAEEKERKKREKAAAKAKAEAEKEKAAKESGEG